MKKYEILWIIKKFTTLTLTLSQRLTLATLEALL